MSPDVYLLVFALAFMGCVLATPVVTRLAHWAGAIDRPDQFRRIHKGATPRLGGLGLAIGLALGLLPIGIVGDLSQWPGLELWWTQRGMIAIAAVIVLLVGILDDTRGMSPRYKLLGQALAVLVVYSGGVRIESIDALGYALPFSYPLDLEFQGRSWSLDPVCLLVTMIWFLGCMNVWNLIDGMDGLASGVGLLVSVTLMLVAMAMGNYGAALLAAALAGGLAGFLLYNWHPACIFLGDSGSLLIGLLLGVIGIQGSMKGTATVALLFPILAMGLPISDTALAIFRRWARNLPLTAADRRHVHHLLIGLGLNPRQAAVLLYIFTAFLCGVVLLGVALRREIVALGLGLWGCVAFLFVLYSRRDELAKLRADLAERLVRGPQERKAAKVTWEAIQRIELCTEPTRAFEILADATRSLGCDGLSIRYLGPDGVPARMRDGRVSSLGDGRDWLDRVTEASAAFRLVTGGGGVLLLRASRPWEGELAADITFRFVQRLGLAVSERLDRLTTGEQESLAMAVETEPETTLENPPPLQPGWSRSGILGLAGPRGRTSWWRGQVTMPFSGISRELGPDQD